MKFSSYIFTKTNNQETANKLQTEIFKLKQEDNTMKFSSSSMYAEDDEDLTIQDLREAACQVFIHSYLELVENPPFMEEVVQRYIVKSIDKEVKRILAEIKENPDIPFLKYHDFDEE